MRFFKRWFGPIALLLVLAVAGGYWFYWSTLADGLAKGFGRWADERRAEGMEVGHGAVEVTGFPYRLELRIAEPRVAAPQLTLAPEWSADGIVIYFQPWQRGRAIAEAQGPQRMGWREGTVRRNAIVTAEQALASFRFTDRGRITRFDADLKQVTASGALALRRADRLQSHGRLRDLAGATALDLSVGGDAIEIDPEASPLGERIDTGLLALAFEPLPASTSPQALDAWRDAGGVLQITALELVTGQLSVRGTGTFALDRQRRPEGAASMTVRGADAFVDAVSAAGKLSGGARLGLRLGIAALESRDENGETVVRIPLGVQDGRLKILGIGLLRVDPVY
jgi:hypothetical protein